MKKHVLLATMILTLGLAAGCGAKGDDAAESSTAVETSMVVEETSAEETTMEEAETGTAEDIAAGQEGTVTGTIDEVTEMYFSIQDEAGTYYQFAYDEESSVDFSQLSVGDVVTITYEGELSDVDTFFGKIISVEK